MKSMQSLTQQQDQRQSFLSSKSQSMIFVPDKGKKSLKVREVDTNVKKSVMGAIIHDYQGTAPATPVPGTPAQGTQGT